MIVISYPTVMDGTVLRWYRDETAAEHGIEAMSASRNGVQVHAFLHQIPDEDLANARAAHAALRDRSGSVTHLVTHRKLGLLTPGIRPVEPTAAP